MNILSFDLEDWFHILDHPSVASPDSWNTMESRIEKNTDRILELLDDTGKCATFFTLGWVAKKYPALVRKISQKHDLGCHSMFHKLVFLQSPEELKSDLLENVSILEQLTGKKINAYRAPGFSFTEETKWLIPVLAEAGILYDCSVFPANRNHGGYAAFPYSSPCKIKFDGSEVRELPMNLTTFLGKNMVFSGGGYFRVLPYLLINHFMKGKYNMTYFHPRDFDPGQPILRDLSMRRKFMSYVGLKNSFSKLKRLLNEHTFMTVEEAGNLTDWENVPVVNI